MVISRYTENNLKVIVVYRIRKLTSPKCYRMHSRMGSCLQTSGEILNSLSSKIKTKWQLNAYHRDHQQPATLRNVASVPHPHGSVGFLIIHCKGASSWEPVSPGLSQSLLRFSRSSSFSEGDARSFFSSACATVSSGWGLELSASPSLSGSPDLAASLPASELGQSVSSSGSLGVTFLSSAALLFTRPAAEGFLESLGFLCIDVWLWCPEVGGAGVFGALLPSGCSLLGGPQIKFSEGV